MTDLVEAVARAICKTRNGHLRRFAAYEVGYRNEARAVIPVVLERAAKVAEDAPTPWDGDSIAYHANCVEAGGFSNGLEAAAAAIRGLGEP